MALGSSFPLSFVLTAVDRLTGPLSGVEGKLGRVGAAARDAGQKLALGISLPLAAAATGVIATSASFEESMLNVRALSGATGAAFEKLEGQAKQLGSTTMFTASQAAEGQATLSLAGLDTNAVFEATPKVLGFAAAANLEFADAAGIAVTVMKGQRLAAEDLTDITDVLIQAQRKSFNTVQDLSEAFTIAGPVTRGMGIEFRETAAVLSVMGDMGFKASLGGTALRGAMAKLALPSAEAKRIFDRLDLHRDDFLDTAGNVKSLIGSVEALESHGATASDILAIFGQRAGPAMQALVGRGAASIREMLGELEKAGGSTTELAEIRMQGASGGMRALKSAAEGLAIAIGDSGLLEWFTSAVGKLTEWTRALSEANPKLLRWGTIFAGVLAILGPGLIVLGSLASVLGFVGAGLSLLLSPIGLVVAGLGALAAGAAFVVANWDRLVDFGARVGRMFRELWGSALEWVIGLTEKLVDLAPDWLVNFLGGERTAKIEISGGPGFEGEGVRSFREGLAGEGGGALAAGAVTTVERSERTARVRVDFANLPPGARVARDGDDVPLDLSLGYSMAAG